MRTTTVALGFKGHIGRAAVVAVASRSDGLQVVAKRRLDLATTFEEGAVYHVAQELPLAKASAMISACEALGLRVVRVPSKELEARARAALGVSEAALVDRLAALGKASGRPWAADQKQSTLAAMVALGRWHNLSGLGRAGRR